MQFNQEQKQAITSLKPLILVSAGAGSGKTRILTERFVYLCELRLTDEMNEAGATVDEIVAITFTEKAAREMKDRIRTRLAEKEREADNEAARLFWKEQKEAVERAYISTFHSFCQRLLRQHAMAADLLPQTRVLDEIDAKSMKREILKTLFHERPFIERAFPLLDLMSKQQLIESIEQIHDYIREFIIGDDAIASLNIEKMIEAQCAAKKERQIEAVREFHEKAIRCVAAFPPKDHVTKAQQNHIEKITTAFSALSEQEDPHAYMLLMDETMPKRSDKRWNEKAPALYELCAVHWKPLKDEWKEIGGEAQVDERTRTYLDHFVYLLQVFAHQYETEKAQAGTLDFSDLQQKAVALLKDDFIKEACKRQFRHMMIDEFQDTNYLQLTMLERIDPQYQFIVGDQKQSIYRFRGANVSLMNEREALAEKEEWAEAILMNTNYRTQAPIIHAVNELFAHAMTSERIQSYETIYSPLKADRSGEVKEEKRVELTVLPKDENRRKSAYEILANRIAEMIQIGIPRVQKGKEWIEPTWSDVAILIPSRSHLLTLERALNELRIPYVVSGGIGFYERQEVVDFLTLLRWLSRPFEDVHLLALLRSPLIGLTVADFFAMKAGVDENESLYPLVYDKHHPYHEQLSSPLIVAFEKVRAWLERWTPFRVQFSLEQTLNDLFFETGLRSALLMQPNGLQKVRNVEKLMQTIASSSHRDLETILSEVDDRIVLSEKEGEAEVEKVEGDNVQVMTVHASKGLEFPIVCLPHLDRGLRKDQGRIRFHPKYGVVLNLKNEDEDDLFNYQTPGYPVVKNVADAESLEESKRLFYVAMTRARDYLYMIGEESTSSQTWLQFIESAIHEGGLAAYIKKSEESTDQQPIELSNRSYVIPKVMKKNEIPLTFSVSEIMLFMNDPLQYFYRFVIGLPVLEKAGEMSKETQSYRNLDPTILGTLVHRACELRDYGLAINGAVTEALSEIEGLTNSLKYEEEMVALMDNYPEEKRQQLGEPIANEWTFTATIEGVEIIGEIDKVVRKEDKYTLIDFKTNRIHVSGEEWVHTYRPQLFLYKMAYEQRTGKTIDKIALYVLRDKKEPLHFIDTSPQYEEMIRTVIRTMKDLRQDEAGKEVYEKMNLTFSAENSPFF